jgi:S-adenosylmethionine:tRNA ribosyltransferase-isomerase
METARFDYHLPTELIAQKPAARRDASRLLVVNRRTRSVSHHQFSDLPSFLEDGDCLFRNVARVLPARIEARRRAGGGRVECLLLRPDMDTTHRWWTLLRPGKKCPAGTRFGIEGEFEAEVVAKSDSAEYLVEFRPDDPAESVPALAQRLGRMPLPPYIARPAATAEADRDGLRPLDLERYQTVFADPAHTVAVAAPTAGLHFTPELLAILANRGVAFGDVVLHVGLGTFKPMEATLVSQHAIHRERVEIPTATLRRLSDPAVRRRIAVGTTSLRTIEHYAAKTDGHAGDGHPFVDEADLFVYPPFRFRKIDALVTNFHLPRSTLLCLVAAFLAPGGTDGIDWLHAIYAEAIREKYRFLSYGDAMLVL